MDSVFATSSLKTPTILLSSWKVFVNSEETVNISAYDEEMIIPKIGKSNSRLIFLLASNVVYEWYVLDHETENKIVINARIRC